MWHRIRVRIEGGYDSLDISLSTQHLNLLYILSHVTYCGMFVFNIEFLPVNYALDTYFLIYCFLAEYFF